MTQQSLDLASLRRAYEAGGSAVDIVGLVYDRIALATDPGIFISLIPRDQAEAAARALGPYDPRKALWGVPFAVKDNIDAAALPTTAACPAFAYQPTRNAFAVQCLIDAGAVLIGKTNLDQFATGLVGVRTPYPAPKNAFDPSIVPGGSSSGSAVAVARDLVGFALGTDTAGSGRVPAALNNIVGLKPSVGAISISGVTPACKTLDCVSIFAGNVDDAWLVFQTMARMDAEDTFQRSMSPRSLAAPTPRQRVGVPRAEDLEFFGDTRAEAAWEKARGQLEQMGAQFVEIDMRPLFAAARLLYEGPWIAERHAALRKFLATNADDVLPVTRGIVAVASKFSATDAFEAAYEMRAIKHASDQLWSGIDFLAVPSIPCTPSVAELENDPILPNARLGRWTNFVNLLDMSALAVPGPFRDDGFPAGITLIGPREADARLATFGRAFHARAKVGMGLARSPTPTANLTLDQRDDDIELVVVGAHLSGMALNRELTDLGAVFSRAVATEPCYKLYALAGGPPRRPGLLRVAEGTGATIATEVWRLSPAAFGRFVAGIPAPLGIGTLRLTDGTAPKGFLVEPEGLLGGTEITSFGGWRNYIAAI